MWHTIICKMAKQAATLSTVVTNLANATAGNQATPTAAAPPSADISFAASCSMAAVK